MRQLPLPGGALVQPQEIGMDAKAYAKAIAVGQRRAELLRERAAVVRRIYAVEAAIQMLEGVEFPLRVTPATTTTGDHMQRRLRFSQRQAANQQPVEPVARAGRHRQTFQRPRVHPLRLRSPWLRTGVILKGRRARSLTAASAASARLVRWQAAKRFRMYPGKRRAGKIQAVV